jgi:hypothetical protein
VKGEPKQWDEESSSYQKGEAEQLSLHDLGLTGREVSFPAG